MHSTRSGKPRRPREPVRWILPGTGTLCPPDVERRLAAPPPALQGPAQPLLGLEHRHVGELSARLVALQDHALAARHLRDLGQLEHQQLAVGADHGDRVAGDRSEEHTSELQSLMRISYAVFCLKKKKNKHKQLS